MHSTASISRAGKVFSHFDDVSGCKATRAYGSPLQFSTMAEHEMACKFSESMKRMATDRAGRRAPVEVAHLLALASKATKTGLPSSRRHWQLR